MHIAPQDRADAWPGPRCAIIFDRQLVAVILELRHPQRPAHLPQPAQRIIAQLNPVRRRNQPVLRVIAVGPAPVRGQIAIGVIGEARRAG